MYRPLKEGYSETTSDLAYIIGVLMGDGWISKDGIGLSVTDVEFASVFKDALDRQFGPRATERIIQPRPAHFHGKEYPTKPQTWIALYSTTTRDLIRKIQTEEWVRELSRDNKISWLRGAWDSEGSVSRIKGDRRFLTVDFSVKDAWFAILYMNVLQETLGISPQIRYTGVQWRVRFSRKADVARFFSTVNPTIERKRLVFEEAQRTTPLNTPTA